MRKLAFIALFGLAVSTVGAAAMDNRPACAPVPGASATSRDLDWDGSDGVGLSVGGHATYTRGSGDRVHASGDPQLLAHLQVHDGEIRLDCTGGDFDTSHLEIILPGRAFKAFAVAGHGDMALHKLDQQTLNVSLAGQGAITGQGKVGDVHVSLAGTGNVDLGQVAAETANVSIAGKGNVDIAPRRDITVDIVGSGDVILHTSTARVQSRVMGSGRVRNAASGG